MGALRTYTSVGFVLALDFVHEGNSAGTASRGHPGSQKLCHSKRDHGYKAKVSSQSQGLQGPQHDSLGDFTSLRTQLTSSVPEGLGGFDGPGV